MGSPPLATDTARAFYYGISGDIIEARDELPGSSPESGGDEPGTLWRWKKALKTQHRELFADARSYHWLAILEDDEPLDDYSHVLDFGGHEYRVMLRAEPVGFLGKKTREITDKDAAWASEYPWGALQLIKAQL